MGHRAVEAFLARIGVIETPDSWWCGEKRQSVKHLYTKCRRWSKETRKLVRELGVEGIRWQIQGERILLEGLSADEKAVASLLRFLKATEIGGRGWMKERELEWEQRNNQAGEDMLG